MEQLSRLAIFGYSLGHVFSDLLSHVYFSYFILYLSLATELGSNEAASIVLISQLCDGFATPLFGYANDILAEKYDSPVRVRKTIHFSGFCILFMSSMMLYGRCFACELSNEYQFGFLAVFAGLTQVGFAAVEVSFLSLVPFLSHDMGVRTQLVSLAQFNNTIAGVVIYSCFIAFSSSLDVSNGLIQRLYFIVLGVGIPAVLFFHLLVVPAEEGRKTRSNKRIISEMEEQSAVQQANGGLIGIERSTTQNENTADSASVDLEGDVVMELPGLNLNKKRTSRTNSRRRSSLSAASLSSRHFIPASPDENINEGNDTEVDVNDSGRSDLGHWLKMPKFYITGLVYVFSKWALLVGQMYTPIFLEEKFGAGSSILGSIPLIQFLSSFAAVVFTPVLVLNLGKKKVFGIGAFFILLSLIILGSTINSPRLGVSIYFFSICLGLGAMTCLVISISLIADLVNSSSNGALIYGLLGFVAKVGTGSIMLVFFTSPDIPSGSVIQWFPSSVIALACFAVCVLGVLR